MLVDNIFAVPVLDTFLVYSPLQQISALVNPRALQSIDTCLSDGQEPAAPVQSLCTLFQNTPPIIPELRSGRLSHPLFLGIIPTRGCNMACVYCDFLTSDSPQGAMSLDLAKQTVEAYFELLRREGGNRADIQFFGGEPFCAPYVIFFIEALARRKAQELRIPIHLEVTTNGLFSPGIARWVGDHFDTVVLSLDGPEDIQDLLRPPRSKKPGFQAVYSNAQIFSQAPVELILRMCVNHQTVDRMAEITQWMAESFLPKAICFETLHPTEGSISAGLEAPDPIQFARQFNQSIDILEPLGIMAIHSTADIEACRLSFCPVGKDALIVSPDGNVDACYLPEPAWREKGLNFRIGKVATDEFVIDGDVLAEVRSLSVLEKPGCQDCLCQFHCAGGCHVRQHGVRYTDIQENSEEWNDHCLQTRLITISRLLHRLGQAPLAERWLEAFSNDFQTRKITSDRLRDRLL